MTERAETGLWSTALRASFAGFAALGLDVERIREGVGIARDVLDDPDARVSIARSTLSWKLAQEQWQKPGLGLHAGAAVPFGVPCSGG